MSKKLVILVVEDDVSLREIMVMFLESFPDVTISQAVGFDSAMSASQNLSVIDLLFCDVHLREQTDGIHIADQVVIAHPEVAVVLLSADEPGDLRGYDSAYAYVRKPFDRKQLTHHIDGAFLKLRARSR